MYQWYCNINGRKREAWGCGKEGTNTQVIKYIKMIGNIVVIVIVIICIFSFFLSLPGYSSRSACIACMHACMHACVTCVAAIAIL